MIGSPLEVAFFDPTEPSSAEILGEWELAIRSMTFEQGMERVLCMFLRDRERAREHIEGVKGENWIGDDTRAMEDAFNRVHAHMDGMTTRSWTWITHYNYEHTVRVADRKTGRYVAVVFPPMFDERGWPEGEVVRKDIDFLSVYREDGQIFLYTEHREGCRHFHGWTHSDSEWNAVVMECSRFFGVPVLPMDHNVDCRLSVIHRWTRPFVRDLADCPKIASDYDGNVTHFIERVIPYEWRKDWHGTVAWSWRIQFLDRYNPGWRERVRRTGSLWME
jgi:hypothetical protein